MKRTLLYAIMSAIPEAQQNYLLEKGKAKKLESLEGRRASSSVQIPAELAELQAAIPQAV